MRRGCSGRWQQRRLTDEQTTPMVGADSDVWAQGNDGEAVTSSRSFSTRADRNGQPLLPIRGPLVRERERPSVDRQATEAGWGRQATSRRGQGHGDPAREAKPSSFGCERTGGRTRGRRTKVGCTGQPGSGRGTGSARRGHQTPSPTCRLGDEPEVCERRLRRGADDQRGVMDSREAQESNG